MAEVKKEEKPPGKIRQRIDQLVTALSQDPKKAEDLNKFKGHYVALADAMDEHYSVVQDAEDVLSESLQDKYQDKKVLKSDLRKILSQFLSVPYDPKEPDKNKMLLNAELHNKYGTTI